MKSAAYKLIKYYTILFQNDTLREIELIKNTLKNAQSCKKIMSKRVDDVLKSSKNKPRATTKKKLGQIKYSRSRILIFSEFQWSVYLSLQRHI